MHTENTAIRLRPVTDADLAVFRQMAQDPESNRMAAFTSQDPYDMAAFDAHWARIRADDTIVLRTVVDGTGTVVGNASVWGPPEERSVSYAIVRTHWGRGLASAALAALLAEVTERPLHARAAADNAGSLRVLTRNGFEITARETNWAHARAADTEEYVLLLKA
ncbi:GNAT family N-acetyltransferase [Streptomyces bambusae]|uniref:GNAT family N-acetyltransferase n=1 Tax=Streptomyces bambusae TaxID=1550616 RepID=UPI001D000A4C|nr:GNAT family N-acetyltransferase [Streptomyces bambusae]MCB5169229.1 GNAT family N-acetyltransferase [Streptomyces bambusae]